MDLLHVLLFLLFGGALFLAFILFAQQRNLKARFRDIVDVDTEKQRVLQELESQRAKVQADIVRLRADQEREAQSAQQQKQAAQAELQTLRAGIDRLRAEVQGLDEEASLQSFGLYQPHYDFPSSSRYATELEKIRGMQAELIKRGEAALAHQEWLVNGSKVEGRKQINQTLKLILRAFNGECDAAVAKVRYNNVKVMEARIKKAREGINKLVEVQRCEIAPAYVNLKLQELYLVHEHHEKVQEEKEEQRRIREEMREEEIAQRQLEKARLDAEKEERRYAEALRKATEEVGRAEGAKQLVLQAQIEELERKLQEAHASKERAIAQAQLTRSGHVYVISNIGSFGEHIFKIGMTRRLDPLDRIRELGDASVPFQYDIHAIIYSDDAPALEAALHRKFNNRRVNWVNERKEFFRVTIEEIADVVRQERGEVEITLVAEAEEYRRTLAMMKELPAPVDVPIAALPVPEQ